MIMEHSINAAVPLRTLSLLTLLVLSQPALAQYAATVSGTGVSGDTVYVFRDGVHVGTVPVVSREWTFHDSAPAGVHTYAAHQTSSLGNSSGESAYSLQQSFGPSSCGTRVENPVFTPAGPAAVRITSTVPRVGIPPALGSAYLFPLSFTYTNPAGPNFGEFIFHGAYAKAVPGATVELYNGVTPIGKGTADSTGNWNILTSLLYNSTGDYDIRATQTTAGGTSPRSASYNLSFGGSPNLLVSNLTINPAAGNVPTNGTITVTASLINRMAVAANVTVTGKPTIMLNSGTVLSYAGGSGTSTLTFSGKVTAGETTSGVAVVSWNLNGGSLGALDTTSGYGQFPAVSVNYPDPAPPVVTCVAVK
jgi:hypothetical protein